MNTLQLLLLGAIGVSLVATFLMKMPRASRGSARKILSSADWLDDSAADGAQVKMTGTVKMREQGERFVSPLSDTRCVVQRVRVDVRRGMNPRASHVEETKVMPFVLEDADGKVLVEADHAVLDIAPIKQSRYTPAKKSQLLAELGHEGASSGASQFEETLVEVGALVTVAGTLVKGEPLKIVGTKDAPIAVRSERASDLSSEP